MDTNYKFVLQKCLNNIDDVKEKLDSEKYLMISNDLNSLYKILENKFYKVRFLSKHSLFLWVFGVLYISRS